MNSTRTRSNQAANPSQIDLLPWWGLVHLSDHETEIRLGAKIEISGTEDSDNGGRITEETETTLGDYLAEVSLRMSEYFMHLVESGQNLFYTHEEHVGFRMALESAQASFGEHHGQRTTINVWPCAFYRDAQKYASSLSPEYSDLKRVIDLTRHGFQRGSTRMMFQQSHTTQETGRSEIVFGITFTHRGRGIRPQVCSGHHLDTTEEEWPLDNKISDDDRQRALRESKHAWRTSERLSRQSVLMKLARERAQELAYPHEA